MGPGGQAGPNSKGQSQTLEQQALARKWVFFFEAVPKGLAQTPPVEVGKQGLPWSFRGLF